jgi:putative ABC transport system ATP-binding protein
MSNLKLGEEVLRAEALSKTYPDGKVQAVKGVNLTIHSGEYVAIMGPSGSGKSTLLNLLGALDEPDTGSVLFRGKSLAEMGDLERYRRESVGYVFQAFLLLPTLTALQNVQIPMFETQLPARARQQKAAELLESVHMSHRADHRPAQLSIGERQRVAIARALANDPAVLLADEPTGNLDTHTGDEVLDLFEQLHSQREMTLVMVTHSEAVAGRAQRIVSYVDGQIREDRPVQKRASA